MDSNYTMSKAVELELHDLRILLKNLESMKYYYIKVERTCRRGCEYIDTIVRATNEEYARLIALRYLPKWTIKSIEEIVWRDDQYIVEAGSLEGGSIKDDLKREGARDDS